MTRAKVRSTATICSLAVAGMAFAATANAAAPAECSRDTLQKIADAYITAQKTGKPATLPLASGATYVENDKVTDISKGVLTQALTVDFTRNFLDTKQCAGFTELVAATHAHPYVMHTRFEATRDGKVTKMESIVTDQDDWVFGATPYLNFTKAENWGTIPADKRDTREAIQAAADSYINHWGNPTLTVLHGTPCARLEGRIYTATRDPAGQTCSMPAFPQPIKTGNRRYVFDETIGAVVIFHHFSWLDAGLPADHPGTPASQMFRVEGGKNRYIHEVTACLTPNCGRGRPAAPGAGGPGGPGPGAGAPGAPAPGAPAAGAPPAAPAPAAPAAPGAGGA
jgi:hypothetical protein